MNHPLKFDVKYNENLSRGLVLAKIFFGWLYVGIPHGIVLLFLMIGAAFVNLVAWFAVLFTGKYPKGMFDFMVGVNRWQARVNAYLMLLTDKYPPFTMQATPDDDVTYEVEYPETLSRGLLLLKSFFGFIYVLIPHIVVLFFLGIGVYFCLLLGFFAILFTGSFPKGMFDFVVGFMRWQYRVNLYFFMTDVYPPFTTK